MDLKQKKKMVIAAGALLIVCAILLVSSSFAWIAMSRMPEISGMSTNIGSNGSLEIALVNTDTYIDPSTITVKVGGSLENADPLVSNLQWGSVVDLSHSDYGLHDVTLIPSRLQVNQANIVGSGLLSIPDYGADGRFEGFSSNTASGTYYINEFNEGGFHYSNQNIGFGVRGIGSAGQLTVQQRALMNAQVSVESNKHSSRLATIALWESNGNDIMSLLHWRYGDAEYPGGSVALQVLNDTATDMLVILDYLDTALRQSVVGYVSGMIEDESLFQEFQKVFLDKSIPASIMAKNLPVELPSNFMSTFDDLDEAIYNMYRVKNICQIYSYNGTLPADQVDSLLEFFFDPWDTYINDAILRDTTFNLYDDNVLTVEADASGGVFNLVPRFVGDFNAFCDYSGSSVEYTSVQTTTIGSILDYNLGVLDSMDTSNESQGEALLPLTGVYGFAIDMAFRCNVESDLLLQTSGAVRSEYDSIYDDNQGAGSYMRFSSEQMGLNQILSMMDALRIGFIDNQNHLLAVAKLNTTSYESTRDGVTVPLYLYDFSVLPNGAVVVGERRVENSVITSLNQDTPMIISAIVWLDGDYVDNSLAAIRDQSMLGVLNLQFSSSADLKPAFGDNTDVTEPSDSTPTEPTETEPVVDESTYYFEQLTPGEYCVYTLSIQGDRAYEMLVETSSDSHSDTLSIQSVKSVSGDTIYIPAVVTDPDREVHIPVTISGDRPFQNVENPDAVTTLEFVTVDDKKVSLSTDSMRNFLGRYQSQDRDLVLTTFNGSGLDTSNVTDMKSLFSRCVNLTTIDLSGWDTSNVTDMNSMFYECKSVQQLDVSHFDTSQVSDMGFMFSNCLSVTELDITSWDTSSLTDVYEMFNYCTSLTELDVSSLNLQNVTSMQGLFSACTSLKQLDLSGLDTSNVENMMTLFHMCSSLEYVDLSYWDTSNLKGVAYLFSYCTNLKCVNMSGWDVSHITHANYMFYQCTALTDLTLPEWDLTAVDTNQMFTDCPAGANYSY